MVVFVSSTDREEALQRARQAAGLGLRSGVLRSGDFPNLQLGLWVAYAGVYDTPAGAQRAVGRIRDAGLAAAPYMRFVEGG